MGEFPSIARASFCKETGLYFLESPPDPLKNYPEFSSILITFCRIWQSSIGFRGSERKDDRKIAVSTLSRLAFFDGG